MTLDACTYSVLIPLKDEEENIEPLVNEIEQVMNTLEKSWELVCVDDGSTDRTPDILKKLEQERSYLRIIKLKQNYGQSTAFAAGFERVRGEFAITLDGDGQNDPADIPKLLAMLNDYDMICGIRQKRQDKPIKRMVSLCANAIRSRVCQDGMKDTGCSLKVYRTSCLKRIKMYEGMHRFLPALFIVEGYKVGQVEVNHRERQAGQSKYSFSNRSFNTIFDMFAVCWMRKRRLGYEVEGE